MSAVKKVYPIEGRKDFFKYIVTDDSIYNDNAKPCIDFEGKEMYFDSKERAQEIATARNKVRQLNLRWKL